MLYNSEGVEKKQQKIQETARDCIEDNCKAANNSFLYYLHEKDLFDTEAFMKLLDCIKSLETGQKDILIKLCLIQNETFKHIIYHFDPNDRSTIHNLPDNYWEYLSELEEAVRGYMAIESGNNKQK